MIQLEQRLLERGYKKHFYDYKSKKLVETDKHIISTMVNLSHVYIKNGVSVEVGLHEYKKPVTLISHRHIVENAPVETLENGMVTYTESSLSDDEVNRFLQDHDSDYIIDLIENS